MVYKLFKLRISGREISVLNIYSPLGLESGQFKLNVSTSGSCWLMILTVFVTWFPLRLSLLRHPLEADSSTYRKLSKNLPMITLILLSLGKWLLAMAMLSLFKKAAMFTDSANKFGELYCGIDFCPQLHSEYTYFFTWSIVWMKHGCLGRLQLIWAA